MNRITVVTLGVRNLPRVGPIYEAIGRVAEGLFCDPFKDRKNSRCDTV